MFDWKQETYVLSEIKNQQLVSKEYKSKDERKNKKGHMHLLFSDGIPKIISAQPHPKDDERRLILNKNVLKKDINFEELLLNSISLCVTSAPM